MIIAESHAEFGAAHGNYEEFRFFTGLRQSEQIALTITDCDLVKGKIRVTKAPTLTIVGVTSSRRPGSAIASRTTFATHTSAGA